MSRLVRPILYSMREAIDGIEDAVRGKTMADYSSNWLLRHGVQRGIEIISEAARRLPTNLRDQHPAVPWKDIFGIGNIIRHEYHNITDKIIWDVVKSDLDILSKAISEMDASLEEEE